MVQRIQLPTDFRIAILGPESTGKTTLCEQISELFKIPLSTEYAREYLTDIGRPYILEDLELIAKRQFIFNSIPSAAMVADTEMTTVAIWAKERFQTIPLVISELESEQHFDLYLLCYPDLPWEADPLREHPFGRPRLMTLYEDRLRSLRRRFHVVEGVGEERLKTALQHLLDVLE